MKLKALATLSATALIIAACGHKGNPADVDATRNDALNQTMPEALAPTPSAGQTFANTAAASDAFEIQSSQLAVANSHDSAIRSFAQKMIDGHTQLNAAMSPVADAMGIRLPKEMDKEDQAAYEKLHTLSGSDFETAYLLQMVKVHHKAMRNYRVEAKGA